jgi:MFS family permease
MGSEFEKSAEDVGNAPTGNVKGAEDVKDAPVHDQKSEGYALKRVATGRPAVFSSTFQEIVVVLIATMAVGLSSMTAGVVTVTSNFIGEDLNMTTAEITWLTASSALASGSFLLLFARIADLFGRRSMFIASLFVFSIFSLGAGFAKSGIVLDVLNGLMGLMAAAAVPPAQGMLAVIYDEPSKRKNRVFACFSGGNPLGFVVGLISGGIATHIFNWRAGFWWLALLYFVIMLLAIWLVPQDTTEKIPLDRHAIKHFDLPGCLLVIAGTGLFSAGLRYVDPKFEVTSLTFDLVLARTHQMDGRLDMYWLCSLSESSPLLPFSSGSATQKTLWFP